MKEKAVFGYAFTLVSLFVALVSAYPETARQRLYDDVVLPELNWCDISQILTLTHQIAVCDLICTGEVIATNDGFNAELAVEELLWGHTATSNIVVRYLHNDTPVNLEKGQKYLVLAYTNNWWHGDPYQTHRTTFEYLYDYLTPTSRPAGNAVFEECRLLYPRASVMDFRIIDNGKTNYWDGMRTYITNFLQIAKIETDELKAHKYVYSTYNDKDAFRRLPGPIQPDLFLYYNLRYGYLPPPDEMYGNRNGTSEETVP